MTMISIELSTGTKYAVDEEYPSLVARLDAAHQERRMVKLKLWGGAGEVQVNPEHVASVQTLPVA